MQTFHCHPERMWRISGAPSGWLRDASLRSAWQKKSKITCVNLRKSAFQKTNKLKKLKSYGKEKHLGHRDSDPYHHSHRYRDHAGRDLVHLMIKILEAVLNFSKKFFLAWCVRFRVCFGRFFGPFRSCSSSDSPLSSSSQKRKCLKNSSQIIAR